MNKNKVSEAISQRKQGQKMEDMMCSPVCVSEVGFKPSLEFLSTESEARDDKPQCCYNTSSNYFLWRSRAIPLSVKLLFCGFLYRILKDVVMNKI